MITALIALAVLATASLVANLVLWSAYQTSQHRLFGAWKDGYVIPAAESNAPRETQEPVDPLDAAKDSLPPEIVDYVSQFEGQDAQLKWIARARSLLRKYPGNTPAVLLELDNPGWPTT